MTDFSEKLPGRQEGALSALLANATVRDAARACNLSEATLYRYMREPAFGERLRASRRSLIEILQTRLQAKADGAAKALSDIAEDDAKPASARVTAARTILEAAIKLHEQTEIVERLAALEKAIEAQKKGGPG